MNKRIVLTAGAAAALVALTGCAGSPEPVFTIPPNSPDTGNITAGPGSVADQVAALAGSIPRTPTGPPAATFGEGTHRVIDDIQPGIYTTGGPILADVPICSWRLMKGDHLVASGSASSTVSIVVETFYTGVESRGCLEWVRER